MATAVFLKPAGRPCSHRHASFIQLLQQDIEHLSHLFLMFTGLHS